MCLSVASVEETPLLLALEKRAGVRFTELARTEARFVDLVVPNDLTPVGELRRAISKGLCWIARCEGQPAGFVFAARVGQDLFVEELSVVPKFGRRGIGTSLMQQVERRAAELDLGRLALTTFRDVPWNAPWYRRLDFTALAVDLATPELRIQWQAEAQRGFDMAQRVLMSRRVPVP